MSKDLLRERLAKYIPPKEKWTPVDEALYGVEDIYNVEPKKAKKLREDAIRYSFKHHYENNKFYHEYCRKRNVKAEDIKTEKDFMKIPLIPDIFFKGYPDIREDGGTDFIKWLEKIYTGNFPKIEVKKKKPSYDDMIEELWKKKVWLNFSTSTTGRFTFLPKDWITYCRTEFAAAMVMKFLIPPFDPETFAPLRENEVGVIGSIPNCSKTMHTSRMGEGVIEGIWKEHEKVWLVDLPVTTDLMRISLGKAKGIKERIILKVSALSQKAYVSKCIKYLKKWEKEEKKVIFLGFPFGIEPIISRMEKKRIKFNFDGFGVYTVGGWKSFIGSVTPATFRKKMVEYFGISEECCKDWYMMSEMSAGIPECKYHYKHIPYFLQPYVLDEEMNPLPYGKWGKFACLDPLANSYPGFISTGDRVKLLEHCPECDKPGPVLTPDISRMLGAGAKGCSAAIGKALEEM